MTAGTDISLAGLGALLRDCREAQRVEIQESYATDQDDFGRTPPEVSWWSALLAEIKARHDDGQQRTRIDVLPDPLNDYWQWRQRTNPWHVRAGEDFWYLARARALAIGLPADHDWWVIDGRSVVQLWFTDGGALDRLTLITDPAAVGTYRRWWDMAISNATQANQVTAA